MGIENIQTVFLGSLLGSLAIVALLAGRRYLRKAFGPEVAYASWAIVPLLFLSAWIPARHTHIVLPLVKHPPIAADRTAPMTPVAPIVPSSPTPEPGLSLASVASDINWMQALAILWGVGAVVALALQLLRQNRLLAEFRDQPQLRINRLRIVRARQENHGPTLIGAFPPLLVLPPAFERLYDARARRLIISHERTHFLRGDLIINFFGSVLACLNWFNPLYGAAAARMREDQEIACDYRVMKNQSASRRDYARALLNTQLRHQSATIECAWGSEHAHPLAERIGVLASARQSRLRQLSGYGAIALLAALLSTSAWAMRPVKQVYQLPIPAHLANGDRNEAPGRAAANATLPAADDRGEIFTAERLSLKILAANILILPEDRTDYSVSITDQADRNAYQMRNSGGALEIEKAGFVPVSLCNQDPSAINEAPELIVRAPRRLALSMEGSASVIIGPSGGGLVETHGCTRTQLAAASRALAFVSYGNGDTTIAAGAHKVDAQLFGAGDVNLIGGKDADLFLAGMGDFVLGEFNGAVKAVLQGRGNIVASAIGGGSELRTPGIGATRVEAAHGDLQINNDGAGPVEIAAVHGGKIEIAASGWGDTIIQSGRANALFAELTGPGNVSYGGAADYLGAQLEEESGDLILRAGQKVDAVSRGPTSGRILMP